jgi:hypothetical protein
VCRRGGGELRLVAVIEDPTCVLDGWFEREVKPRLRAATTLIRYADDFAMCFERPDDAGRGVRACGHESNGPGALDLGTTNLGATSRAAPKGPGVLGCGPGARLMKDFDDEREETHVSEPGRAPADGRTVIGPVRSARTRPLGAREAFVAAFPLLRPLAGRPGAAVVAAAVDPDGAVLGQTALESGQPLILGRHTRCGLRLPSERVSLRQLAVHVRLEGDAPVTRLWDLGTATPFVMEDGATATAVVAEGPLLATLAEYALVCAPAAAHAPAVWAADAAAGWEALPPRTFIDLRGTAPARRRHPARDLGKSCISRIEPVTRLGEEPEAGPAWAELTLEGGAAEEHHRISAEQISRGVLVGRYPRCLAGEGADVALSRVHLLVVRIGDEVWAIDTASTNGTRRNGCDVEAVVLGDEDELTLPGPTAVRFRRVAHAAA